MAVTVNRAFDGDASDIALNDLECVIEQPAAEFQNSPGFGQNFGADTIPGKKRDLFFHAGPAAAPVAVLLRAV